MTGLRSRRKCSAEPETLLPCLHALSPEEPHPASLLDSLKPKRDCLPPSTQSLVQALRANHGAGHTPVYGLAKSTESHGLRLVTGPEVRQLPRAGLQTRERRRPAGDPAAGRPEAAGRSVPGGGVMRSPSVVPCGRIVQDCVSPDVRPSPPAQWADDSHAGTLSGPPGV